ncbi:MAG: homoserine kinase [Candidatus Pelagibacterales bacterium]|jgi:homoserine kinase type II|tara:strand:- start:1339 stop:2301 length:963 start_codon:yes stop_codon:yes gene_type:complete
MAVYTQISIDELNVFLSKYNIDNINEFSGIKGGTSNSNYLLTADNKKFILTIFEERTNQENLPFYFDLMNHLNAHDIKCPEVIKDKQGNFSNSIKQKHAVITSFLTGSSLEKIKPIHCSNLGLTIAKMHNASEKLNIKRENELGFDKLGIIIEKLKTYKKHIDDEKLKFIEDEFLFLSREINKDLPSGIIHADLFPDNIFFEENNLTGIIDFYFSCNDFYAYEIAICLNAWCFEDSNNEFNPTKAKYLLGSYNQERKFSNEEVEALPLLARASALRYLLTRLLDFYSHEDSDLILKKDPNEYISKLRFHQSVRKASEYGL